jgi:hypothetical protein
MWTPISEIAAVHVDVDECVTAAARAIAAIADDAPERTALAVLAVAAEITIDAPVDIAALRPAAAVVVHAAPCDTPPDLPRAPDADAEAEREAAAARPRVAEIDAIALARLEATALVMTAADAAVPERAAPAARRIAAAAADDDANTRAAARVKEAAAAEPPDLAALAARTRAPDVVVAADSVFVWVLLPAGGTDQKNIGQAALRIDQSKARSVPFIFWSVKSQPFSSGSIGSVTRGSAGGPMMSTVWIVRFVPVLAAFS